MDKMSQSSTSEKKEGLFEKKIRQRKSPFVSLGCRLLTNVDALNMVESAGAMTRHRTVPIVIVESESSYRLKWVPALSGETLAHAFQVHLANLSKSVCYFCKRNEFLKHAAMDFYERLLEKNEAQFDQWEKDLIKNFRGLNEEEIEKIIIQNCVVEDIGGFLLTTAAGSKTNKKGGKMVRRTSVIQFSYCIPSLDALETGASTTDVQMQVRMASEAQTLASRLNYKDTPIQAPYNREIASTTYSFIVNIDFDAIGYSSYTNEDVLNNDNERKNRYENTLRSLKLLLDGNFGAGMSRYRPFVENEVILLAISKGPVHFTVSPPSLRLRDFITETIERAKDYLTEFDQLELTLYLWVNEGKKENFKVEKILKSSNLTEGIPSSEYKYVVKENKQLKVYLIYSRTVGSLIDKVKEELGLIS